MEQGWKGSRTETLTLVNLPRGNLTAREFINGKTVVFTRGSSSRVYVREKAVGNPLMVTSSRGNIFRT
jgi:hypothetical protein